MVQQLSQMIVADGSPSCRVHEEGREHGVPEVVSRPHRIQDVGEGLLELRVRNGEGRDHMIGGAVLELMAPRPLVVEGEHLRQEELGSEDRSEALVLDVRDVDGLNLHGRSDVILLEATDGADGLDVMVGDVRMQRIRRPVDVQDDILDASEDLGGRNAADDRRRDEMNKAAPEISDDAVSQRARILDTVNVGVDDGPDKAHPSKPETAR